MGYWYSVRESPGNILFWNLSNRWLCYRSNRLVEDYSASFGNSLPGNGRANLMQKIFRKLSSAPGGVRSVSYHKKESTKMLRVLHKGRGNRSCSMPPLFYRLP